MLSDAEVEQRRELARLKKLSETLLDNAERDSCVICLQPVSDVVEARPCKHNVFDYGCLLSWLHQVPQCPLCKARVDHVRRGSTGRVESNFHKPPSPKSATQYTATRNRYTASSLLDLRSDLIVPLEPEFRRPNRDANEDDPAIVRRRLVYSRRLRSSHVGSNRISGYRELVPQMFRTDEELVSRARMFIRRELRVFPFLHIGDTDCMHPTQSWPSYSAAHHRARNAELLLEYIIGILKSVDIQGSGGEAEKMLRERLGREHAVIFLHELRSWLRSPYRRLSDWDAAVQYNGEAALPDDSRGAQQDGQRVYQEANTTLYRNRNRYTGERYRDRYRRRTNPLRRAPMRQATLAQDQAHAQAQSQARAQWRAEVLAVLQTQRPATSGSSEQDEEDNRSGV